MVQGRPSLSEDLKREIRKRCGFGCVMCGRPICEYDHILGWAKVKRHRAAEITLLCDNHHREKTGGFLSNERVIEADKRPFNIQRGATSPYALYYGGGEFLFKVGSLQIEGTASCQAVRIDGESLLGARLEDGHLLLSLKVYDSSNDVVLIIDDNELVLNIRLWDIEVVGSRITIREGLGAILFDIVFRPPSSVVIMRGRFLCNGVEFLIAPKWCAILNSRLLFRNITIKHFSVGFDMGEPPSRTDGIAGLHVGNIPRHGWDRQAAINWVRNKASSRPQVATVLDELLNAKSLDLFDSAASTLRYPALCCGRLDIELNPSYVTTGRESPRRKSVIRMRIDWSMVKLSTSDGDTQ